MPKGKLVKTDRMAQIKYVTGLDGIIYDLTSKVERRIWTDGVEGWVKIDGSWHDLKWYENNPDFEVQTWYEPIRKREVYR